MNDNVKISKQSFYKKQTPVLIPNKPAKIGYNFRQVLSVRLEQVRWRGLREVDSLIYFRILFGHLEFLFANNGFLGIKRKYWNRR